jgi:hypothetical protein
MAKPKTTPVPYEDSRPAPTAKQAEAVAAAKERQKTRPARVAMAVKVTDKTVLQVSNPHSDGRGWSAHVNDTFGTTSNAFSNESLMRIAGVLQERTAVATETQINATLALLGAIAPRSELETVIGEQIVAAHVLSMGLMHQAKCSDTIPKMEAYTNMATKVSRTMAAHVDTLGKLRAGGKQTHEVRHIYINGDAVVGSGAQAVFGGLDTHTKGLSDRKPRQAHEPGLQALCGPEVRGEDAGRDAVPAGGHEGA